MTICGENFVATPTVRFGTTFVTVNFVSATELRVTTPPGSGFVTVIVTNPNQEFSTGDFLYLRTAPSITSVTPPSGPMSGGIEVTINGTGFDLPQVSPVVRFGGLISQNVTFRSATQVKAIAPANAPGVVDVGVVNTDLQAAVREGAFTYAAGKLYTIVPCRFTDTRFSGGALLANMWRPFSFGGSCGGAIPSTARALAVNIAVLQATTAGNLIFNPTEVPTELLMASTINYNANQTVANGVPVLPLGPGAGVAVWCAQATGTVHMILDVFGYYE